MRTKTYMRETPARRILLASPWWQMESCAGGKCPSSIFNIYMYIFPIVCSTVSTKQIHGCINTVHLLTTRAIQKYPSVKSVRFINIINTLTQEDVSKNVKREKEGKKQLICNAAQIKHHKEAHPELSRRGRRQDDLTVLQINQDHVRGITRREHCPVPSRITTVVTENEK